MHALLSPRPVDDGDEGGPLYALPMHDKLGLPARQHPSDDRHCLHNETEAWYGSHAGLRQGQLVEVDPGWFQPIGPQQAVSRPQPGRKGGNAKTAVLCYDSTGDSGPPGATPGDGVLAPSRRYPLNITHQLAAAFHHPMEHVYSVFTQAQLHPA